MPSTKGIWSRIILILISTLILIFVQILTLIVIWRVDRGSRYSPGAYSISSGLHCRLLGGFGGDINHETLSISSMGSGLHRILL